MATLSAIHNNEPTTNANAVRVHMKLELVIIPVSDVDRAKEFYARLGWRLDADFTAGDDWRGVQFTPPGSGCSVIFGRNVTAAAPGSAQGLYLIVSDIEAARNELLRRGVRSMGCSTAAVPCTPARTNPTFLAGYGSAVQIPDVAATARSRLSVIRTATDGSCRKLQRGCLVASIPQRRPSHRRTISRARFCERRQLTASTRSVPVSATRTGPPGTPLVA
jgi:predicted enzyme related to lactoylglutathione lyase